MSKAENLPPVDDVVDRLDLRTSGRVWTPPPFRLRDLVGMIRALVGYGGALLLVVYAIRFLSH